jgi:anti-sigma factor RsiW
MTHDEAIREQAVERYLLGELSGDARDRFEEHFFDCVLCAADLTDGARFVDALRSLPPAGDVAAPAPIPQRGLHVLPKRSLAARLTPWLTPALAASLLLIAYQNLLVLPGLRHAAASLAQPAVLNNVVLANLDARGADIPSLSAPAHGSFVVSLDVPSRPGAVSYLCALYDAQGHRLWEMPVTAQQAENTIFLRVPADKATPGQNELRVLAVSAGGGAPSEIGRYHFNLSISQ